MIERKALSVGLINHVGMSRVPATINILFLFCWLLFGCDSQ